jgi:hypothetical protein
MCSSETLQSLQTTKCYNPEDWTLIVTAIRTSKHKYKSQRYWVFGLSPSSGFEITKNTMFQKLDLFPSSGEGRQLLCWVP